LHLAKYLPVSACKAHFPSGWRTAVHCA
jgi:hypothetical protein